MPISRMLQPRQNYGLGSFVKKAVGKVTKPITKLSKKIVPKEIAGIMRVAAPFLPPGYREAAYLMGTARQTGRISPMDLALTAAPTFFSKTNMGRGIANRVGNLRIPGMDRNLRQIMVGTPKVTSVRPTLKEGIISGDAVAGIGDTGIATETIGKFPVFERGETVEATSGLFGKGGEMYRIGKGGPGILDTKVGETLFGKKDDDGNVVPSFMKIGTAGLSVYDYIKTAKSAEEAGQNLVDATGDPDSYQIGYNIFTDLQPSVFDIPEQFRLAAAEGGLMRENYALGSMPTAEESGLGGLPIEADMRYTGGFMPYGAKEKADDVPARLSKNEFVFTADAVRAAGGGSVQKGAQKMYNTMKQLESQPEAKGMMA